ncbi:hypothetical protein [Streptomyces sp. NPDC001889]
MPPTPRAYPELDKAPGLPTNGAARAACTARSTPFDDLDASPGTPPNHLVDAAARICDGCPVAAACPVRVHRRAAAGKRRAERPRSSRQAKTTVTAFLRTHGETTAPAIHDATGLPLHSIRSAIHDLHTDGRISKRPASPGSGNRVYLTLTQEAAI